MVHSQKPHTLVRIILFTIQTRPFASRITRAPVIRLVIIQLKLSLVPGPEDSQTLRTLLVKLTIIVCWPQTEHTYNTNILVPLRLCLIQILGFVQLVTRVQQPNGNFLDEDHNYHSFT